VLKNCIYKFHWYLHGIAHRQTVVKYMYTFVHFPKRTLSSKKQNKTKHTQTTIKNDQYKKCEQGKKVWLSWLTVQKTSVSSSLGKASPDFPVSLAV
jgi:hypothetical protein